MRGRSVSGSVLTDEVELLAVDQPARPSAARRAARASPGRTPRASRRAADAVGDRLEAAAPR
jgi:hypothetical protein